MENASNVPDECHVDYLFICLIVHSLSKREVWGRTGALSLTRTVCSSWNNFSAKMEMKKKCNTIPGQRVIEAKHRGLTDTITLGIKYSVNHSTPSKLFLLSVNSQHVVQWIRHLLARHSWEPGIFPWSGGWLGRGGWGVLEESLGACWIFFILFCSGALFLFMVLNPETFCRMLLFAEDFIRWEKLTATDDRQHALSVVWLGRCCVIWSEFE